MPNTQGVRERRYAPESPPEKKFAAGRIFRVAQPDLREIARPIFPHCGIAIDRSSTPEKKKTFRRNDSGRECGRSGTAMFERA